MAKGKQEKPLVKITETTPGKFSVIRVKDGCIITDNDLTENEIFWLQVGLQWAGKNVVVNMTRLPVTPIC